VYFVEVAGSTEIVLFSGGTSTFPYNKEEVKENSVDDVGNNYVHKDFKGHILPSTAKSIRCFAFLYACFFFVSETQQR
jgi:hypothetical protein